MDSRTEEAVRQRARDSGELVRLYDPRKDRWNDHFQVNAGFIEGRTAVGRGTTALLGFNAKDRVRLRRVMERIPS